MGGYRTVIALCIICQAALLARATNCAGEDGAGTLGDETALLQTTMRLHSGFQLHNSSKQNATSDTLLNSKQNKTSTDIWGDLELMVGKVAGLGVHALNDLLDDSLAKMGGGSPMIAMAGPAVGKIESGLVDAVNEQKSGWAATITDVTKDTADKATTVVAQAMLEASPVISEHLHIITQKARPGLKNALKHLALTHNVSSAIGDLAVAAKDAAPSVTDGLILVLQSIRNTLVKQRAPIDQQIQKNSETLSKTLVNVEDTVVDGIDRGVKKVMGGDGGHKGGAGAGAITGASDP